MSSFYQNGNIFKTQGALGSIAKQPSPDYRDFIILVSCGFMLMLLLGMNLKSMPRGRNQKCNYLKTHSYFSVSLGSFLNWTEAPWQWNKMRLDSPAEQSWEKVLSRAAHLNALIVEVLWDEAVHFLPVLWQLEQRTNTQEDASRLTLLQKDLNWK